ncbi:TetR family transcriptional regulator [Paucibacter sp. APW11]|uniref:TetR family transcriptional regulator n=1 Tax=Roseateles aquae TaxID=3077235 RepID=A0ABU3P6E6_9BURK|nr:TetR family transcriptional regulator [Paucibacter sp. APW11]MDT8998128.1 TetR family transcriptional regulator [Paucibacter sp. APW11]
MPRPSQAQDKALLEAGQRLYIELGCAGLSVRRLAEAAGVNPAMVHYHFGSKAGFLRSLLQQYYEQMFASLSGEAASQGSALQRLRACLAALAGFVSQHRQLIGRLWADAQAGETVALEFMRANAPRHLGLLMELISEAQAAGELRAAPLLSTFAYLIGAVVAPLLLAGGALRLGVAPAPLSGLIEAQVLSGEAIAARIELALAALAPHVPGD